MHSGRGRGCRGGGDIFHPITVTFDTQHVIVSFFERDFHTRNNQDVGRRVEIRKGSDGVVIGNGQKVQALGPGHIDQFQRIIIAVGKGGMGMKIASIPT